MAVVIGLPRPFEIIHRNAEGGYIITQLVLFSGTPRVTKRSNLPPFRLLSPLVRRCSGRTAYLSRAPSGFLVLRFEH
jgi:hypothetical protein